MWFDIWKLIFNVGEIFVGWELAKKTFSWIWISFYSRLNIIEIFRVSASDHLFDVACIDRYLCTYCSFSYPHRAEYFFDATAARSSRFGKWFDVTSFPTCFTFFYKWYSMIHYLFLISLFNFIDSFTSNIYLFKHPLILLFFSCFHVFSGYQQRNEPAIGDMSNRWVSWYGRSHSTDYMCDKRQYSFCCSSYPHWCANHNDYRIQDRLPILSEYVSLWSKISD